MLLNRGKSIGAHGAQSLWALMGTLGTEHEKSFKNRCPVPTGPLGAHTVWALWALVVPNGPPYVPYRALGVWAPVGASRVRGPAERLKRRGF